MARKKYEPEVVDQLKARLADVRAAKSVFDLLVGGLQFAQGGKTVSVSLTGDHRLLCQVNHVAPPRDERGEVDWTQVSRIKVMAIERDAVHA